MAISKLEVGVVPLGVGGDSLRSAAAKINENFSNTTHAASKLVGTATGQVPLVEQVRTVLLSSINGDKATGDVNDYDVGSFWYTAATVDNSPSGFTAGRSNIETRLMGTGKKYQLALGWDKLGAAHRHLNNGVWTEWQPLGWDKKNYNTTTAAGANAVIDIDGRIIRSTSSERYKDILSPLELDDARYADAMALKPIVYRSTANADNPAYHYYSFSAEELGTYDPAFTLWRETETVTDEYGNVTEQPLTERQAEGININALLAMSHAIAIKQGDLIKDLQEQIDALKLKLEV